MTPALLSLRIAEKQHHWFDYRIDGWSAWRVLRNQVYNIAEALPLSCQPKSRVNQFRHGLAATLRVFYHLIMGKQRDLMIKSFRSALRLKLGDYFRDVYFDGILDRQPSHFKLEVLNTAAFSLQAKMALRPADMDAYAFTFWGAVLGRLLPRREAKVFCSNIAKTLDAEIGIEILPAVLLRHLSAIYWESRLYALLLARIRPKIVLVADTSEFGLRLACSNRGIPFVEIQHGVFDEDHPDSVPDWVQGSLKELLLPDVLACYGQFWVSRLSLSRQLPQAYVVGNELVDRYRTQRSKRNWRDMDRTDAPLRLLFTSQGLDTRRAVAWLEELLTLAPTNRSLTLYIKLHPVCDHDTAPFASLAARYGVILVSGAQEPNVWELLCDSDLHLSISSACHFDAAALGVPSVVMPLKGHHIMESAIDGKTIFAAPTPASVWAISLIQSKETVERSENYSSSGFVDQMDDLIVRILTIQRTKHCLPPERDSDNFD